MLAILLISGALCYMFGVMVGDTRQGWVLLAAMLVIFVPLTIGAIAAEQVGNPALTEMGVDQRASSQQSGGNMEGKETRYGIANSALWASATTGASNGSVNSMHDSFTPCRVQSVPKRERRGYRMSQVASYGPSTVHDDTGGTPAPRLPGSNGGCELGCE
jgi:K+-transporting ATPase A subunit